MAGELLTAKDIQSEYLASLPENYASRYSALASESTIAILLDAAESGLNATSSCAAAGISLRTLQRWQQDAEANPDSPQGLFVAALKHARAHGQRHLLKKIREAGEKPQFWAANAWTLERTDPEQFALRKDTDSSAPKVIVQIGASVADVKIAVVPSPQLSEDIHRLSDANTRESLT